MRLVVNTNSTMQFTIKKECEENLEFLKRFPVFHSVSPSSMSRLSESVTPRSFKVDEGVLVQRI